MSAQNQFSLMRERRFAPLFVTQFCGAFNDNVFKNALLIFITFHAASLTTLDSGPLANLCAGLFILPFFLFSATAGQLADKMEKTVIIRWVKAAEILMMLLGAVGFALNSLPLLLATLFLLGTHSTVFGPVKYSILPQHLKPEELVGGNGLIESGTFLSILIGTLVGGVVAADSSSVALSVGITTVLIALIGFLAALKIPLAPSIDPTLKVNWNPITESIANLRFARKTRSVFLSILGISWFWLFGGTYLTQFPNYVKITLGGNEHVVTLLLAIFSIGIGIGSLLCERLSGRRVEIGLVPFGAAGLALFSLDLYFASPQTPPAVMQGLVDVMSSFVGLRVLFDLLMIGLFGGFFIVPLYAFIQTRSEKSHQSRIIAGNNILNAGFMVAGAIMAAALLHFGFSIPQLFLVTAILHILVSIYIFTIVPEFLMRFLIWMLMHTIYRLKTNGIDRIPNDGPAVLACNHVSFVDALVLAAACPRPVVFVTYYKIYKLPLLNFIFRTAKAIPIAGAKEDLPMMNRAFERVAKALKEGELVCIFPEGKITETGELSPFRSGINKILSDTPVPVIPIALRGLWGSFFSRKHGRAMSRFSLERLGSTVVVEVGEPVAPQQASPEYLQQQVALLRGDML